MTGFVSKTFIPREDANNSTANGEIFDPELVSAAHKTLPMPSVVRVTNLDNGKSLVVRINDRGPYVTGRIIDMSRAGARLLGFKDKGIARVRVQMLTEQSLHLEKLAKDGIGKVLWAAETSSGSNISPFAVNFPANWSPYQEAIPVLS